MFFIIKILFTENMHLQSTVFFDHLGNAKTDLGVGLMLMCTGQKRGVEEGSIMSLASKKHKCIELK